MFKNHFPAVNSAELKSLIEEAKALGIDDKHTSGYVHRIMKIKSEQMQRDLQHKMEVESEQKVWQIKMESQQKVSQLQIENEQKLKDMEMALKQEMSDLKTKYTQSEASLKLDLAAVTQRWLLEMFFQKAKEVLLRFTNDEQLETMSQVSKEVYANWPTIKEEFELTCQFPKTFPGRLLYGHLSERVHIPEKRIVYMSSRSDPDFKELFKELADKFAS